ncbi:MAG TPA: SDR family oxidoreductase [Bacteroidetes bacterium]|nr:SDR family oxidoreductase [Bacteroidota bacterium]
MALFLVTGGAGFIGSNLARKILENGDRVRVFDDLSTGKMENIEGLSGDIEFIKGDIRDLDAFQKAAEGVEYILHQAALPSVPRSIDDPISSNEVNVVGTVNVLVAARDKRVKRIVLASSSSVYGNTEVMPKTEELPLQPVSPYAVSKMAKEKYALSFNQVYGLPAVALRYFNVFGPNQDPNSHYAAVIPKFITAMLRGDSPTVYGDGEQSRDFTYVDNVVHGNLLACESDAAVGHAMNMACGGRYTLNFLLGKLEELMGRKANAIYTEPRRGDVLHSHAGIELARRLLKFEPQVSFEDGLAKTVDWYRQKYSSEVASSTV